MTWGFIWMVVVLKIPVVALLWLCWWAIQAEPEPAADESNDGGDGGSGHSPRPRRPRAAARAATTRSRRHSHPPRVRALARALR